MWQLGAVEPATSVALEHLPQLADSLPQLGWTTDAQGQVDYYNRRVHDYGGWELHDGLYDWQPLVHPDDLDATIEAWTKAFEAHESYEFEHRVLMADGTYRWHLSRALPLRNEAGEIVRWFGTATDIHSQKLLEHNLVEMSETLQRALLPTSLPQDDMQLAARYNPALAGSMVGGDWYDAVSTRTSLCLVIGDVAGHGIAAAAAMGACRHALSFALRSGLSPAQALESADDYLTSLQLPIITCCIARIDLDRHVAEIASAGHPPPIVRRGRNGAVGFVDVPTVPPVATGWVKGAPSVEIPFGNDPSDTMVLYTDGLVERRGESFDIGLDRLTAALTTASGTADEIAEHLSHELGVSSEDDLALLVARVS